MPKISTSSRISPAPNVHARRFDNELVILDLDRGTYFGLDDVGADMWEGFVQGQSPAEVGRSLSSRYATTEERLIEDATHLAERLADVGLVVVSEEPG